ncbi:MAG: hypothetical protein DRQ55_18635 [Planctomycetota bacterium]|nr:MAG: hypothetical protein DRQ55_18635 [Planctomycetota bacterium]
MKSFWFSLLLFPLLAPAPEAQDTWHLDRIDQNIVPNNGILDGTSGPFSPGCASTTVYVVGTGIDTAHPEFGHRASVGYGSSIDLNGQGTYLASLVGGLVHGVDKNASVVSVQVLNAAGPVVWTDVVAGLQWIDTELIAHPNDDAIVLLGFDGGLGSTEPLVAAMVTTLTSHGALIVVAAGDAGGDACSSVLGTLPDAMTVGATDRSDNQAAFSAGGACVDVLAPGEDVEGAAPGAGVSTSSSTSASAAIVAGAASFWMSVNALAAPADIKDELLADYTSFDSIFLLTPGTPNRMIFMEGLPADKGAVVAWGGDTYGQATPPAPEADFTWRVSAGDRHSLAISAVDQTLVAWGDNAAGQVAPLPPIADGIYQVSAGGKHSLAVYYEGGNQPTIAAWGDNTHGQLDLPLPWQDWINTVPIEVSAGGNHSMVLGDVPPYYPTGTLPGTGIPGPGGTSGGPGSIGSWGDDTYGQVSDSPHWTGFVQVSAGGNHSMALDTNPTTDNPNYPDWIMCWGDDSHGQVSGAPAGAGFVQISAGGNHSLALRDNGSIVAWGDDTHGQVYDAPHETGFTFVSAGGDHSVALDALGRMVSWGKDLDGQVWSTPSEIGYYSVSAGGSHTLAVHTACSSPSPCAGVTGNKVSTMKLWGAPSGTDWWWYLDNGTSPTAPVQVPGVSGDYNGDGTIDVLDVADAFADSINAHAATNGWTDLSATTSTLFGSVYLTVSSPCQPKLLVNDTETFPFCDTSLMTACHFNPQIELILLPGIDCNQNGIDDELDLDADPGLDANANGILDECEPSAWTNEGFALAGVNGDPLFVGFGDMTAGSSNPLGLSNAAPGAFAAIFYNLESHPTAFRGGTIVPGAVYEPLYPFMTSAAGEIFVSLGVPSTGLPVGTEIWLQWLLLDSAAVHAVAMSNAIKGVSP